MFGMQSKVNLLSNRKVAAEDILNTFLADS